MSFVRAVRRSDVEWRNYQNDTCATYSANKWCGGGKLNVPAMGGPIMGSPEWACCACNDRRVPPDTAGVTEIIFYATHNIEIIDRQVLVRYTQELTPVRSDFWSKGTRAIRSPLHLIDMRACMHRQYACGPA